MMSANRYRVSVWTKALYYQAAIDAAPDLHQKINIMFLDRLENIREGGDRWLTVESVFSLMNDCSMVVRATSKGLPESKKDK